MRRLMRVVVAPAGPLVCWRALLVGVVVASLAAACSCSARRAELDASDSPSTDAPGNDPPVDVAVEWRCPDAARRCNASISEVCSGGVWTTERDCWPDPCSASTGLCVDPCSPEGLVRSYSGCEFWAVDLPQWDNGGGAFGTIAAVQQYAIAVANPWPVEVVVVVEQNDAPLGAPTAVHETARERVPPEGLTVVPLPAREVDGFLGFEGSPPSRSLLTSQAYRVRTSRPTSVYQFNPLNNPGAYSNDASLLIPVTSLDESYVALGWPGHGGFGSSYVNGDARSFLTIVASRADTHVRVIPSATVGAGDNVPLVLPGTEYVVTLGEFDVLNLEGADLDPYGPADFTGTRIEADGPLALFSGVQCTLVPDFSLRGACDHLEEQIFPRSSLGHDYAVTRLRVGSAAAIDDLVKVLGLVDGTTVTTSLPAPDGAFTLARGEARFVTSSQDFTLAASEAVMVGHFMLSSDPGPGTGDPSFVLDPPVIQYRTRYIFLVPSGYDGNAVVLAMPAGVTPTLDGAPITSCVRLSVGAVGATTYDAMACGVPAGSHTIEAAEPFGLMVVGWASYVSYGYTGGMDFTVVNYECADDSGCGPGEFCSGGICVACIEFCP